MEGENKPMDATTTFQEDLTTSGQRRINMIWECTQAAIALSITAALLYASVNKIDSPEIRSAFFLIIGFYFSRTNHSAIGGTGKKPNSKYEGR